MLLFFITAAAYFYFNLQYFRTVKKISEIPYLRVWFVLLCFVVNYSVFAVCSLLEFSLILNWILFGFLLLGETFLYTRGSSEYALCSTLIGMLYGLAVNIFCRSIIAIIMNLPLQNFDNHTASVNNIKGIPVCLGFLLAGMVMQVFSQPSIMKRMQLILKYPRHYTFLLEIMTGMLFYLFLNLLLYSVPLNDLLLKIWSIKSCLFSTVGFYIAIRYTVRICELEDYREKNQQMKQELKMRQWEQERLRQQAALDSLTGLYNRQIAEETIASMMEQMVSFTLCFLDLDGLKKVNDQYGHEEGDRYILTAIKEIRRTCRSGDSLFRYGGDEFLILFIGMEADMAAKRAETINSGLHALEPDFSYPLSMSYGVVESPEFPDWKSMLREADRKMYEQKRQKKVSRDLTD